MCRFALLMLFALATCFSGGCATFLNDDHDMVAFSSEPDGATVLIDGVAMGKTPCTLPVPRKGFDKAVEFKRPGYKTVSYELKNGLNLAVAGNIIFGGVIGLGVDAISGRGGEYQPSVHVLMEPGQDPPPAVEPKPTAGAKPPNAVAGKQ